MLYIVNATGVEFFKVNDYIVIFTKGFRTGIPTQDQYLHMCAGTIFFMLNRQRLEDETSVCLILATPSPKKMSSISKMFLGS